MVASDKTYLERLRMRECKFVVMPKPASDQLDSYCMTLFEDAAGVFFDPDHLSAQEVGESFSTLPQAGFRVSQTGTPYENQVLEQYGVARKVVLEVPSFSGPPTLDARNKSCRHLTFLFSAQLV